MKNFKFLEHTADVRIEAVGKTLEELFAAALEGLCSVLMPETDESVTGSIPEARKTDESVSLTAQSEPKTDESVSFPTTIQLEIQSIDTTALLIDFLSDALMYMQTNNYIYNKVKFDKINPTELTCALIGNPSNGFFTDVKAVTHHEAYVIQNKDGGLQARFLLDI